MNNRQITDEDGVIAGDDTPYEEAATQEQTTAEEGATAEKSAEPEDKSTQDESEETENDPELIETASDETGNRYVPEKRFKEVYAKWKQAERAAKTPLKGELESSGVSEPQPKQKSAPINKADALEIELLRATMPQFNPLTNEYSPEIDELGYSIHEGSKDSKGNYTMTRLDAGRQAIQMAKKISSKIAEVKKEALSVKAQQSDQGIANRVLTRDTERVDPEKMSLEEKEEWLKANDLW